MSCLWRNGGDGEKSKTTEKYLIHKKWTFENIQDAQKIIENEFTPISDARSSAEFRKTAAKNLLLKFFEETKMGSLPHDSAIKHVTGESVYVNDIQVGEQMLYGHLVYSKHAHAQINLKVLKKRGINGVKAILSYKDIPGQIRWDRLFMMNLAWLKMKLILSGK